MRTLNAESLALLARAQAGEQMPMVQLIEVQLTAVLRLTTAGLPLLWGGYTWQPLGVSISPVDDDVSEFTNLVFTLPAVSPDQLAVALTEDVEGRTVRVWDALIDPDTGAVAMAVPAWSGALDVPSIQDGPEASISVNAEHRGALAVRVKPTRYTNDEQQRLYPGDTCLQFDPATDAAPMVWPAASFFRQ
jgi:hypothetical protein